MDLFNLKVFRAFYIYPFYFLAYKAIFLALFLSSARLFLLGLNLVKKVAN